MVTKIHNKTRNITDTRPVNYYSGIYDSFEGSHDKSRAKEILAVN